MTNLKWVACGFYSPSIRSHWAIHFKGTGPSQEMKIIKMLRIGATAYTERFDTIKVSLQSILDIV